MTLPRLLTRALSVACLALATAAPVTATPAGATPVTADPAATRPASVTGWYVDPVTGSTTVSVHGSAEGVPEWAADHLAGPVTVEHVAEAPRPFWDLVGGQLIHSGVGRCTLGFNARSGTARYVVTAGHCIVGPGTWSGVGGPIGPGVVSSFPGNDYGLIRVTSADAVSTPLVDRYTSGGDVTITAVATPPVGSSVCYSSPATGWRCASLTGINQTVCYPQGCVHQLIRTNLCAGPGSSGAPVVTNPGSGDTVRAIGLIAGGSGNCSTGGTTWVQPLQEVLATHGLTLYTG